MATLELERVVKRFGDAEVIHSVDLRVESGEFCVFVGPSGCGKSTLLRMIAGLETISDGEIRIAGQRVNELGAAQRGLAMVFQSYALYPHMSVRQNLAFGLENIGTPKQEVDRRVMEASRMLQIDGLLERKPRQLSGGQRQRVAIGRAVVREPRIFLFDEPLSNLDAELRVQMRVELASLHRRLGNTMIYVTHDQVEAMTMADRIVVLRSGRVEQVGAPLDLYNRPANRFVAGFIGSPRMNFLEGRLAASDGRATTIEIPGMAPLVAAVDGSEGQRGEAITLGVRPESLAVAQTPESGMAARVETTEQLGSESYLYCSLPDGQKITIHHPGQTRIRPADMVHVSVDPAACHVFRGTDLASKALPRVG